MLGLSQHQKLLLAFTAMQTFAYIAAVAYGVWRDMRQAEVISDLLDRVMARDYSEYNTPKINGTRPARRYAPLTDEQMAEMERQARAARPEAKV